MSLIIAEIGINHNGSMEHAKKLIDQAYSSGCGAVKFQKRNPDICVPDDQKPLIRETPWGNMTYLEYKWKVEFNINQYKELFDYTKKYGMHFIVSCWDIESISDIDENIPVDYHKVPSALVTDKEFLQKLYKTGKPIILSTGMSNDKQVDDAVQILGKYLEYILACTSTYPSKEDELNINYIKTLKQKYPKIKIGFSNHYSGLDACLAAAALGSDCIEFHITDDRSQFGTDQSASIKNSLTFVQKIRVVEKMMGDGVKKVYDSEVPIMKKLRKER
tara:strand:- start:451 stop:1275 length:825 start_codon:yes stop_codon:yes gene_type:complete